MKRVLAIDLGASSGRGIVFECDNGTMNFYEIHRFDNNAVQVGDTLRWDVDMLFEQIKTCIALCAGQGKRLDSIGIDTWGVDYGVIDDKGKLKEMPYHYRDARTAGFIDRQELFDKRAMFDMAGISLNEFNTSYQLIAQQKSAMPIVKGDKILFMPYLLGYMLTGKMGCDATMATTGGFYLGGYDERFLAKVGLTQDNFPDVRPVGSVIGYVKDDICRQTGIDYDLPVIATCGHDTACAIMTVMQEGKEPLYVSSGTWSLFGTLSNKPIVNDVTYREGYTNEIGFDDKICLLKNIMGMWIIQECRREWIKQKPISWDEIVDQSCKVDKFKGFINVADNRFSPPYSMDERIVNYVSETQGLKLSGIGEIARCVYNSLAMEYRYALEGLQAVTGKSYDTLHIIGGGTNNHLLNQLVADCLGIKVVGGCVEATAIGNALGQLYGLGEVKDKDTAYRLAQTTFRPVEFFPSGNKQEWQIQYDKYLRLKK
ncbi:MAG: rhamnulokinase family protein [Christensenellales bacterium]